MTKMSSILMIVAAMFLGGCSHSQWASVELATQGASWLNPVATVVHMTASAGRAMTDPQDELREKVQQREEERKTESTPEQSQPGPPKTETK
jgi:major membrane immunogen (membrane-anchored lipoprotein)